MTWGVGGVGTDTCVEYLIKGSQTYSLYVWQASAKNKKINHTLAALHVAEGRLMNTVAHTVPASSQKKCNALLLKMITGLVCRANFTLPVPHQLTPIPGGCFFNASKILSIQQGNS